MYSTKRFDFENIVSMISIIGTLIIGYNAYGVSIDAMWVDYGGRASIIGFPSTNVQASQTFAGSAIPAQRSTHNSAIMSPASATSIVSYSTFLLTNGLQLALDMRLDTHGYNPATPPSSLVNRRLTLAYATSALNAQLTVTGFPESITFVVNSLSISNSATFTNSSQGNAYIQLTTEGGNETIWYLSDAGLTNSGITIELSNGTHTVHVLQWLGIGSNAYVEFHSDISILFSQPTYEPGSLFELPLLPQMSSETFTFTNAPSGRVFDPPWASGYSFEMMGTSRFKRIISFPESITHSLTVDTEGNELGSYSQKDSVDFVAAVGHAVTNFIVSGLLPYTDASDITAFPIMLEFESDFADFTMTPIAAPMHLRGIVKTNEFLMCVIANSPSNSEISISTSSSVDGNYTPLIAITNQSTLADLPVLIPLAGTSKYFRAETPP